MTFSQSSFGRAVRRVRQLPSLLSSPAVQAGAVSVAASAAILVLQQLSFRLLAPTIGSSIETWSTIVGVFLLAIAAGNWAGGYLADRVASPRALGWCTLGGGVSTAAMLGLAEWLKGVLFLSAFPLAVQIGAAALLVCFLPAFVLSLLTPLAIKSLLARANEAGRAAGVICALGTAGSLIGNYLTGFVLIPFLAVNVIGLLTAGALLSLGLVLLVNPARPKSPGAAPAEDARSSTTTAACVAGDALGGAATAPLAWPMLLACGLVFVCSFVSGALESAAFRMLAPLVGSSIFLSTGVIGVVLAGVSVGNYWGGRLASGSDRRQTLPGCLLAASFATLAVAPLLKLLIGVPAIDALPLVLRIMAWSFLLFFAPSLALGMISPQVIRLAVTRVDDAGRIAGRIYAWSTLGCVAGILATGWLLIEWLGVLRLTTACGFALLPLVVVASGESLWAWARARRLGTAAFVVTALALIALARSPYDLETKYFSIAVLDGEKEGRAVKRLVLDRLVHSEVDLNDPSWLGYPHESIQADITRFIASESAAAGRRPQVLVIGGGGYTFPKWVEAQPDLCQVEVEVVEIDPGVTEIAQRALGLSRSTRIVSHHLDGRQFVKQAQAGAYPLIIQDAVNDFSVPYHLLTKEYNDLVQRALAPDGVYLLTVIDSLDNGPLLRAALRTLRATFADVQLLVPKGADNPDERRVYVLAAFNRPYGAATTEESCARQARLLAGIRGTSLPPERLTRLLNQDGPQAFLLTDQYAPVDRLLTRVIVQK